MTRTNLRPALAALSLLMAACTAPPAAVGPSTAPGATSAGTPPSTPVASAAVSASPSAAAASPVPSPSATEPSASPSAAPSGGFTLANGKLLRTYDFQGIGGLHFDRGRNQIVVIDAQDDDETPRKYLMRRFERSGAFDAAIPLNMADEDPPEAVDGFAFDLAGVPVFTYRDEEEVSLRRLYTATVQIAQRLPIVSFERAGLAAVGTDGDVITFGAVRYDPDALKGDTRERTIQYARAEEDKDAEGLFRIPDPFEPTVRMAVGPGGVLYLMGPTKAGTLELKALTKDQQLTTLPVPLARIPDHLWVDPAGDLYLASESTGNEPARIRRIKPDGTLVGEVEVVLADGRKVFAIDGLTWDLQGKPLLAGTAIAADLRTQTGIFTFD